MSSLTHEATPETGAGTPTERPNVLARIEAYKRREIAEAKLRVPLAKLERKVAQAEPVRGFAAAIRSHLAADRPALIAEVKKAYRKLSREKHPDKNPDNPEAVNEFIQITKAYTVSTAFS